MKNSRDLGRKESRETMGGEGRGRKNNGCRKSRMPIVFFVSAIGENNCVGGAQKAKQYETMSFIVHVSR